MTIYELAERFVGMKEVPGVASNPMILAMLRLDQKWPEGDEVPWCSAFLNWCAWLLRLPRSKSLMARSWLQVGHPVWLEEAKIGDVVVLWRGSKDAATGHVGLFSGRDGDSGSVYLLGGNQGNSVSVQAFPVQRVLGVRVIERSA